MILLHEFLVFDINFNLKFFLAAFQPSRPGSPDSDGSIGTRMTALSNRRYGSTESEIERDPTSFETLDLNVPSNNLTFISITR